MICTGVCTQITTHQKITDFLKISRFPLFLNQTIVKSEISVTKHAIFNHHVFLMKYLKQDRPRVFMLKLSQKKWHKVQANHQFSKLQNFPEIQQITIFFKSYVCMPIFFGKTLTRHSIIFVIAFFMFVLYRSCVSVARSIGAAPSLSPIPSPPSFCPLTDVCVCVCILPSYANASHLHPSPPPFSSEEMTVSSQGPRADGHQPPFCQSPEK